MIKQSVAALFLLFTLQKTSAQKQDSTLADSMIRWLKGEQYDSLTNIVSPASSHRITSDVFRHIRAAMLYRNDSSAVNVDEINVKINGNHRIVSASLTGAVARKLYFSIDSLHRLSQIYLAPAPYGASYRDAAYADTSLYEERSVLVQTGPFLMPGTFTVPKGRQNFPILVFVHGSGSNNRDEALYALKPFRDLSLGLAAKGIATLRYDKRTKVYPGPSALPPGQLMTIQSETTDDARSAITLAARLPGVDSRRIYVIGHSLGGMMIPQIAMENKILAGAIIMSGPARTYEQTIEDQYRNFSMDESLRAEGLAQLAQIKHLDTLKDHSTMLLNEPVAWWAGLQQYNQLKVINQVKMPLLLLQGQRDCQVPASDIQLWKKALARNKNVEIKLYPRLNHYYGEGKGAMSTSQEYYLPANVPAYVVNDIAGWILSTSFPIIE